MSGIMSNPTMDDRLSKRQAEEKEISDVSILPLNMSPCDIEVDTSIGIIPSGNSGRSPAILALNTYAPTPLHAANNPTTSINDTLRLDSDLNVPTLEEYVRSTGGNRAISRVLIANNGIAAVKCIRSIRKWCYETFLNDKIVQFVVMATPEDLNANAEYIHLADEFVPVPGGSNNNNYANIHLITEIAEEYHCDAVWAGWGHASENPKLPELLQTTRNKVVWIGPPSHAMRALGDKIGSTLIAQSAGVSCMSWSGDGLNVDYQTSGLPEDIYNAACINSPEEAKAQAERIGYPVMIKASEGGGGKGIRKVENSEDVAGAYRQVQGEVPGSPVFIMKLAGQCRHLEVQLLCDTWGNACAVFGRDCSIQRRHQKIIEEGPVVAAPPDVWRTMEDAAVRLAKEVGYVGAGTVEYLYMENGEYSFLELNPRLQVEHPVTELISGVNLPAAQLQIAMGIPLDKLPGIRRMYGQSPLTSERIDFNSDKKQALPLHVIACRITAENPDEKFQPTSGLIQELNFRSTPDVWGYFSVGPKGHVHEFADSQFGHLFAVGSTRENARKSMVHALKELEIRGEIRTTIEYLRGILEADDFRRNKISTTWLETMQSKHSILTDKPSQYLAIVLGALYRAHVASQQREGEYNECLMKGHLPSPALYHALVHGSVELIYESVKYTLTITKSGVSSYDMTLVTPSSARLKFNSSNNNSNNSDFGSDAPKSLLLSPQATTEMSATDASSKTVDFKELIASCEIHNLSDGGYLVLLNGKKHLIYGREFPSGLRLSVDSMTCQFSQEYDPTSLRAETQGKLVHWLVNSGDHVVKNQAVAEMEVMKMYITIRAAESGVITTLKAPGAVIESGDLLARFVLDNPEQVQKVEIYGGVFAETEQLYKFVDQNKPHVALRQTENQIHSVLSGYELTPNLLASLLQSLELSLNNPNLPSLQAKELLSNVVARLPATLYESIQHLIAKYDASVLAGVKVNFPSAQIKATIEDYLINPPSNVVPSILKNHLDASGFEKLLDDYMRGNYSYVAKKMFGFLDEFLSVEEAFQGASSPNSLDTVEEAMATLRKQYKDNVAFVSNMARSHHQLASRAALISSLLSTISINSVPILVDAELSELWVSLLQRLASLKHKLCGKIVMQARQNLVSLRLPSMRTRLLTTLRVFKQVMQARKNGDVKTSATELIDQTQPIEDVILLFLTHPDYQLRKLAVEAYVRRAFRLFSMSKFESFITPNNLTLAGMDLAATGTTPSILARWVYHIEPTTTVDQTGVSNSTNNTSTGALALPSNLSGLAEEVVAQSTNKISASDARMKRVDSLNTNLSRLPLSPHTSSSMAVDAIREDNITIVKRMGIFAAFDNLENVKSGLGTVITAFNARPEQPDSRPLNVMYIYINQHKYNNADEDVLSHELRNILSSYEAAMKQYSVRRCTFIIGSDQHIGLSVGICAPTPMSLNDNTTEDDQFVEHVAHIRTPTFLTYRKQETQDSFQEDKNLRYLEPNNALYLQLDRLSNFDYQQVPTTNRIVHLFAAVPKNNAVVKAGARAVYDGRRFFARVLVRRLDSVHSLNAIRNKGCESNCGVAFVKEASKGQRSADAHPETESAFVEALNSLEIALARITDGPKENANLPNIFAAPGGNGKWLNNHIFINVLVDVAVDSIETDVSTATLVNVEYVDNVIRSLTRRYANRIRVLNVGNVEFSLSLRMQTASGDSVSIPVRFFCSNPSGHVLHVNVYYEKLDLDTKRIVLVPFHLVTNPIFDLNSIKQYCMKNILSTDNYDIIHEAQQITEFQDADAPYDTKVIHQQQRLTAAVMDTVWCYDFLEIYDKVIRNQWRAHLQAILAELYKNKNILPILNKVQTLITESSASPTVATTLATCDLPILKSIGLAFIAAANYKTLENSVGTQDIKDLADLISKLNTTELPLLATFAQTAARIPTKFVESVELVLSANTDAVVPQENLGLQITKNGYAAYSAPYVLKPVTRPAGMNDIAMVAWDVKFYTPECLTITSTFDIQEEGDNSRPVVIIANDITREAGSFGAKEDMLFDLASKRARDMKCPRFYLAANSGARIGLAEELKNKFQIGFIESDDDFKSFEYIYLTEDLYQQFKDTVICQSVDVKGETRYIITDIVGQKEGLGVENLRGSGAIAGETSKAYEDIFTLTYVTCRTVGIGAYLARLGQRVIQKADPAMPLLLTGYQALNKLLGRPVYSSNTQLGGPDVMYHNGVSHQIVPNDLVGCGNMMQWLSYVAINRDAPYSRYMPIVDPIDREISFQPDTKNALYDPHQMLIGTTDATMAECAPNVPMTGLFDANSFMEVMGGWAKGIVAGKARLGGIPVGVICVDPRTTEHTIPVDPAGVESKETLVTRAGQVWYPESSYKTAQAIFDMAAEDIPLVLLANFRGFSGDSKSMYDMVLKFGSYIVDSLRKIQQPIVVYIPPYGTLRGGAWVVVDETVNHDWMELYADPTARGGVLEPDGLVDVKYRKPQLLVEMHRLDPKLRILDEQVKNAKEYEKKSLMNEIKSREILLGPTYLQMANHFADLHDTPNRMIRKGCLREVLPWKNSRERLFYRLRARLLEHQNVQQILKACKHDRKMLEFIGKQYNVLPSTNEVPSTTTTTIVSDINIGRAILQAWFVELSGKCPHSKQSLTVPALSTTMQQDKQFIHIATRAHVEKAIQAKVIETKKTVLNQMMKNYMQELEQMNV